MDFSFDWRGLIIWIIDVGLNAIVFFGIYYFFFYRKLKRKVDDLKELIEKKDIK